MKIIALKNGIIAAATALLCASSALANGIVPTDATPGEKYRLVFLTNNLYSATSSNIADYDADVTVDATANPSFAGLTTTWQVIGSTSSVSAIDHIALPAADDPAIFQASNASNQEVLIASDLAALFSASVPGIGEAGGNTVLPAWTGTLNDGATATGNELGSASPVFGNPSDPGGIRWDDGTYGAGNGLFLYAISGELTAPGGAVPEPASLSLLGAVATVLLSRRRRSRLGS